MVVFLSVNDEKHKTKIEDDESEPSFVLLYNIAFERSVNLFLNQYESYTLYEVSLTFSILTVLFSHFSSKS